MGIEKIWSYTIKGNINKKSSLDKYEGRLSEKTVTLPLVFQIGNPEDNLFGYIDYKSLGDKIDKAYLIYALKKCSQGLPYTEGSAINQQTVIKGGSGRYAIKLFMLGDIRIDSNTVLIGPKDKGFAKLIIFNTVHRHGTLEEKSFYAQKQSVAEIFVNYSEKEITEITQQPVYNESTTVLIRYALAYNSEFLKMLLQENDTDIKEKLAYDQDNGGFSIIHLLVSMWEPRQGEKYIDKTEAKGVTNENWREVFNLALNNVKPIDIEQRNYDSLLNLLGRIIKTNNLRILEHIQHPDHTNWKQFLQKYQWDQKESPLKFYLENPELIKKINPELLKFIIDLNPKWLFQAVGEDKSYFEHFAKVLYDNYPDENNQITAPKSIKGKAKTKSPQKSDANDECDQDNQRKLVKVLGAYNFLEGINFGKMVAEFNGFKLQFYYDLVFKKINNIEFETGDPINQKISKLIKVREIFWKFFNLDTKKCVLENLLSIENLKNLDKANEDKLFTLFKDLPEHQELFFNQYNQNQGNDKRIYELFIYNNKENRDVLNKHSALFIKFAFLEDTSLIIQFINTKIDITQIIRDIQSGRLALPTNDNNASSTNPIKTLAQFTNNFATLEAEDIEILIHELLNKRVYYLTPKILLKLANHKSILELLKDEIGDVVNYIGQAALRIAVEQQSSGNNTVDLDDSGEKIKNLISIGLNPYIREEGCFLSTFNLLCKSANNPGVLQVIKTVNDIYPIKNALKEFPIVEDVLCLLPIYEESFDDSVTQLDSWIDTMAMLLPKQDNNQADRLTNSNLLEKFRFSYYFGKKGFFLHNEISNFQRLIREKEITDKKGNPLNITSQRNIVEGYRKLAVATHPDKNGSADEFLVINSLYNNLSDSASESLKMKEKEFLVRTQSYITKANKLVSVGFLTLKLLSSHIDLIISEPNWMNIFEISKNVISIASLFNPSSAILSYGVYSFLTYQFIQDTYNLDMYAAATQLLYNAGSIYLTSFADPSYCKILFGASTALLTLNGAVNTGYKLFPKFISLIKNTADKGGVTEQYEYAKFCQREGNNECAAKYLKKAADNNHIEAQYYYGRTCAEQKDAECAAKYLKKAADNNHVEAQIEYGSICIEQKDAECAKKYLKKAADNNHIEAQYYYGLFCKKEKDAECTKEYLKKAADNNHVEAQYRYGLYCKMIERDTECVKKYLELEDNNNMVEL